VSAPSALRAALSDPARPALVVYLCAGDPTPGASLEYLVAAAGAGADVLEVGVPFSDPMADGPAIQRASERALAAGMTLRGALHLVAALRRRAPRTPVVLFGYLNPFLRFGPPAALAARVRDAGASGLLCVDLPVEEAARRLAPALRDAGLDLVPLVAPTTSPARLARVKEVASGFVYYVTLTGVTGARLPELGPVRGRVAAVRAAAGAPVAVGFGISTAAEAAAAGVFADGVVVGSAAVRVVAQHGAAPEGPDVLARFVSEVADAVHRARAGTPAAGGEA